MYIESICLQHKKYVHVCVHVHLYMFMYICSHTYIHVHIHVHVSVHVMCECVCTCVYMYTCTSAMLRVYSELVIIIIYKAFKNTCLQTVEFFLHFSVFFVSITWYADIFIEGGV